MNDTSNTTNAASQSDIPQSVSDFMRHITDLCGGEHARWAENFNAGFANTLTTTVRRHDDGTTFLLTGDIPAMWLRDSSAQFRPYLAVAVDDPELTALITGLVRQQFRFINIDPYANAFNETPSGATWDPNDQTDSFGPWLWERKYEVDSLCYPIQLAWLLYRNTGTTSHFDDAFVSGIRRILDVFETELDHSNSHYRFFRPNDDPRDSVPNHGTGGPFAVTGMTWSGFRPSDDACVYPYLVPSNVPNLMSAPYLGFCEADDPLYLETRNTLLSQENPYYFEGDYAHAIGSPHTPEGYVWPIAMAMQGLTSHDKAEKERILDQLVAADAGTHLMHESFDANDPNSYTRPWFSWANMMFCELVMDYFGIHVKL